LSLRGASLSGRAPSISHRFQAIAKRAGIKRANPHMWRHTAGTELARNGANTAQIQRILGHEHLSTTEIYLHLAGEDVLAAHRAASPASKLFGR
jgi:integrase/recombinase XerC